MTYSDCSDPWTFCRCSDADDNLDTVVSDFGRVPVPTRDNVRYVVLSAQNVTGKGSEREELEGIALYWDGDLVVYGNWSTVGLFVHEAAHNMDYWIASSVDTMYSETQEWRDIVDSDTCVADSYAKFTYTETFAQAAVLLAYDRNVEPIENVANLSCMSNTMEAVTEKLGDYLTYVKGATCGERFPYSEVLCLSDGKVGACAAGDKDKSSGKEEDDDSGAPRRQSMGRLPVLYFGTALSLLASLL